MEVAKLSFDGPPPDAGELSRRWHAMLAEARENTARLPAVEVGKCVLTRDGELFRGDLEALKAAMTEEALRYHAGSIRGAFPLPGTRLDVAAD